MVQAFCSDKSRFAKPGPITIFRPVFPKEYCAGSANAEVLNHSAGVSGPSLGFATKVGRCRLFPPTSPIFATSWPEDKLMVNGAPLSIIRIVLPHQPPSSWCSHPLDPL